MDGGGSYQGPRGLGSGRRVGTKHRSPRHAHCIGFSGEPSGREDMADKQDKTVLIHSRPSPTAPWSSTPLLPGAPESKDPHFPDAVWRVSWSLAGNILAVSCGDGKVSLWKEGVGRGWECVSDFSS